jgi:hypothetical protein
MTRQTASSSAASKRAAPNGPSGKKRRLCGGTSEANRMVVAILEVLAGLRTPAEAAQALRISLPRYYALETRAVEGMVSACEPKPLGKQPSADKRIAVLEKELRQARHECARQQALVRAAQRTVGLSRPAARPGKQKADPERASPPRRRRRPTVRALRAAKTLRENSSVPPLAESLEKPAEDRATQDKSTPGHEEQYDGSQGKETTGHQAR